MIANIERAANLFLVLALMSVVMLVAYPLAPVQLTLISAVTIGILALGPTDAVIFPVSLRRVLRFAVPTGVVTGAAAYAGYLAMRVLEPASGVAGARTAATLVVLCLSIVYYGHR